MLLLLLLRIVTLSRDTRDELMTTGSQIQCHSATLCAATSGHIYVIKVDKMILIHMTTNAVANTCNCKKKDKKIFGDGAKA